MSTERDTVFPARAGVFPGGTGVVLVSGSLPRASGGVPWNDYDARFKRGSSPRERGCSR
ncbi:hypothetical protein SAMN05421630_101845 [Prauserella marina]|uniref:Uncharacterized protein n=1 Tax=Prauserella marina TaxID=530584 RepID=A0A1G6JSG5_9PSEU|nr:hypothetical protein SAMN05421630_101845 [Prauserella marina]